MKQTVWTQECGLQEDRPLRLERAAGVGILCLHGTVWLTQEGSAADVFLSPAQSWTIENNGLALLEAMRAEGARIRIVSPQSWRSTPGGILRRIDWCPQEGFLRGAMRP